MFVVQAETGGMFGPFDTDKDARDWASTLGIGQFKVRQVNPPPTVWMEAPFKPHLPEPGQFKRDPYPEPNPWRVNPKPWNA